MKSIDSFICKPANGNRYENERKIGGIDLIVNTSEESAAHSSREAEVIELPLRYEGDVKIGDILVVHHNVFKFYNRMDGSRSSGRSFFRDDLFLVDEEQYFAVISKEFGMRARGRYCFVSPIHEENDSLHVGSVLPLHGILRYPNDYLRAQGLKKGDRVVFTPESEYEFNIDGSIMFRVFDHQIAAVYE